MVVSTCKDFWKISQSFRNLVLIFKKKYGASIKSGSTEAKEAAIIVIAWALFGITCQAIKDPVISAKDTSIAMMVMLFFVGMPYFFVSATMCGFQWGTCSKTK